MEWRTLPEERKRLAALCSSQIALVRKKLHGRMRTEMCKGISYYTKLREHLRPTGRLGKVIASILGNHPDCFMLESLAMDDITEADGTIRPMNSIELHMEVARYFEGLWRIPAQPPDTPADIIHGGLS